MTILYILIAIVAIICNVLFMIKFIHNGNYEAALGWGSSTVYFSMLCFLLIL